MLAAGAAWFLWPRKAQASSRRLAPVASTPETLALVFAAPYAGDPIKEGIVLRAAAAGLDPAIALATAHHESNFNFEAYRAEPSFYDRRIAPQLDRFRGLVPERVLTDRNAWGSYGIGQVLLSTAIEQHGFRGDPGRLFESDLGIQLMVAHLVGLVDRYGGNLADVFAAYNSGQPLARAPAVTRDTYVPRSLSLFDRYRRELEAVDFYARWEAFARA